MAGGDYNMKSAAWILPAADLSVSLEETEPP